MSTVEKSIEASTSVRVAHERMCHFEDYPRFMSGMQRVVKLSEDVAAWAVDHRVPPGADVRPDAGTPQSRP